MLVLKEFSFNPLEDNFLTIKCRQEGLFSFLLNKAGLDNTTILTCSKKSFCLSAASLKEHSDISTPLCRITEVKTSIRRPVELFFIGAILFVLGIVSLFIDAFPMVASIFIFLFSVGTVLCYIIKKDISFGIKNGGDNIIGITTQPAVLGGERIDEKKFIEAAHFLRDTIENG